MTTHFFSRDMRALLRLLPRYEVRYVIIGGAAVIYHGHARLTGDIDLYYEQTSASCDRLFQCLLEFWGGTVPGLASADELLQPGIIVQFGRPPNRIDLISSLEAVRFDDAWAARVDETLDDESGPVRIHFMGLRDLIRSKEQAGGPKDREDLKYLRKKLGQP